MDETVVLMDDETVWMRINWLMKMKMVPINPTRIQTNPEMLELQPNSSETYTIENTITRYYTVNHITL